MTARSDAKDQRPTPGRAIPGIRHAAPGATYGVGGLASSAGGGVLGVGPKRGGPAKRIRRPALSSSRPRPLGRGAARPGRQAAPRASAIGDPPRMPGEDLRMAPPRARLCGGRGEVARADRTAPHRRRWRHDDDRAAAPGRTAPDSRPCPTGPRDATRSPGSSAWGPSASGPCRATPAACASRTPRLGPRTNPTPSRNRGRGGPRGPRSRSGTIARWSACTPGWRGGTPSRRPSSRARRSPGPRTADGRWNTPRSRPSRRGAGLALLPGPGQAHDDVLTPAASCWSMFTVGSPVMEFRSGASTMRPPDRRPRP